MNTTCSSRTYLYQNYNARVAVVFFMRRIFFIVQFLWSSSTKAQLSAFRILKAKRGYDRAANLIVTSLPTALARLPNKSQAQKVNKNFPTDFPIHPSKCVGKEAKMFVLGKQRSNYDDVGHHSTLGQKCKIFPRILCCHWFVLSVDRNSRENEAIMT